MKEKKQQREALDAEWQANRLFKEHGYTESMTNVDKKIYIEHIEDRARQQYWIEVKLKLNELKELYGETMPEQKIDQVRKNIVKIKPKT